MRTSIKLTAGLIIATAAGFGVWEWTRSVGRDEITNTATMKGFCRPGDCMDGLIRATSRIAEKHHMHPSLAEWCVGVKKLSPTRVRRNGWLKSLTTEVMNTPCPELDDHLGL